MRPLFYLLLILPLLFSCSGRTDQWPPVVPAETVGKDMITWLRYSEKHLRLSEEFRATDSSGSVLSKASFLQQLATGAFLPLRLQAGDASFAYQLYRLPPHADKDIRSTISALAKDAYDQYLWEGKKLPPFRFTDLDGRTYTPDNTKGKILVLKCWFIHCVRCVQEMPALNKLVDRYKNRDDVLFISLATDEGVKLRDFLKKRDFTYAVVPEAEAYITNALQVSAYPTHLLVSREGTVSKVVTTEEEIAVALDREVKK
jgi:peroxiredoxin